MSKRKDYISWDEYFMGVALLASQRSKDPSTQVGACIVNDDNRIMSVGYNGFPRGCSDDEFPWEREGETTHTKYPYVCHAELNAILNAGGNSLKGCRIYVALFPCNECAKAKKGKTKKITKSEHKLPTPAPAPKAVASNANAPQVEAGISGEVVAAIAAAIAVSEGEGAVVNSIRKVNVVNVKGRNPWANAAVYDNTRPF